MNLSRQIFGVKAIVWDLDGTLLDSFGIHVDIMTQVLVKHGRPEPTWDELRHNFHGALHESLKCLAGLHTSEDELQAMLADFLEIDNVYIQDVDHHLFVDAVGLAKRAHAAGVRQILVTNRPHGVDRGNASPRNIVQNSILSDYIDEVICGDEVELRKPSPEVLGDLLSELDPNSIITVGDQAVDAQFAHNLRGRAVLINRL